jgi:predicted alpha/beta-fold hydrolase
LTPSLAAELGLPPFQARFPWWGGDLQTLRDTLRPAELGPDPGERVLTDIGQGDQLVSLLDRPNQAPALGAMGGISQAKALVLVLHGLGGSSQAVGVRRLGQLLQREGFAVLRPNMRGAGLGRPLARGSYAAQCNRDLLPLLAQARQLADGRPLLAVGLSLGGTMLLNGCLAQYSPGSSASSPAPLPRLDGLACVSSPLDLAACSAQIDRPRNRLYQRWLLQRLVQQVRSEPLADHARGKGLTLEGATASIRSFDAQITAPRWGYRSVEHYYAEASPLPQLLQAAQAPGATLPPTLWLHSRDDPWVPADATEALAQLGLGDQAGAGTGGPGGWGQSDVVLTSRGGHNGFHGQGDPAGASWSDRFVLAWLQHLVGLGGVRGQDVGLGPPR